jgi:hypothetical protein
MAPERRLLGTSYSSRYLHHPGKGRRPVVRTLEREQLDESRAVGETSGRKSDLLAGVKEVSTILVGRRRRRIGEVIYPVDPASVSKAPSDFQHVETIGSGIDIEVDGRSSEVDEL